MASVEQGSASGTIGWTWPSPETDATRTRMVPSLRHGRRRSVEAWRRAPRKCAVERRGRRFLDAVLDEEVPWGGAGLTNWAGNHGVRGRRGLTAESLEQLQEIVQNAGSLRVLGSRAFVQRHRRHDRRPRLAGPMPRVFELDPRPRPSRSTAASATAISPAAPRRRAGPAQPRLAAAHLGCRAPARRQPTGRATASGTWRRLCRRSRWSPPMARSSRSLAAETRRVPRRGRRARRRSASSRPHAGPPADSGCARTSTRTCPGAGRRSLRRHHVERGQREPVHRMAGRLVRAGVAQASRLR